MNSWVETLRSDDRLQEYENILQEITEELQRHEKLKKEVETEDNKIIAVKLSKFNQQQSISRVFVKIFNSIFEIHNLYEGSLKHYDFVNLVKMQEDSYKFYLVEVCLATCMVEKLFKYKCKLHICVKTEESNECINKIRTLDPKNTKMPLVDVIPVKSKIKKCTIEPFIIIQFENNQAITIKMDSVQTDISYHFESARNKNKFKNLDKDFLNISKLYENQHNFKLDLTEKRFQMQAQMLLKNPDNKNEVVIHLDKNCYHRIDLQQFSKFCKDPNENVLNIQFCVDSSKIALFYNYGTKILKIKSNYRYFLDIKTFFLELASTPLNLENVQTLLDRSSVSTQTLGDSIVLHKDTRKIFL